MTGQAGLGRAGFEQVGVGLGRMDGMAGRAIQRGLAVRAGHEPGAAFGMALQACFGFLCGQVGRLEGENIGSASFLDMFLGAGVARCTAGRSDRRVGLLEKALDGVFMARAASLGVLGRLLAGFGRDQQTGSDNGQYKEPERLDRQGDELFLSLHWQHLRRSDTVFLQEGMILNQPPGFDYLDKHIPFNNFILSNPKEINELKFILNRRNGNDGLLIVC